MPLPSVADRLAGKVALVTGAARGTGAAIARIFAAAGARVILADVLDERGTATAKSIGERARYRHLDVRNAEDWQAVVSEIERAEGRIDVLVNNAAVLVIAGLEATRRDDFLRMVEVNQLGPFLGIQAVAPIMRAQGGGSIINIASTDGVKGMNGVTGYASTKWALRGITKSAAMELGRDRIRVNAICPEAGGTEIHDNAFPPGFDIERAAHANLTKVLKLPASEGWQARVDDVARMALFLASDESASCTGGDYLVDAGTTAGWVEANLPGGKSA
jgi:3alpha(or 20beta)-hydroxysteroid dehydrogenase